MNYLKSSWYLSGAVLLAGFAGFLLLKKDHSLFSKTHALFPKPRASTSTAWHPPNEKTIPHTDAGNLIRYGKELVAQTAAYLGPKGRVATISNGMNCQNCHPDAGTRNYGNPFSAVASTYPRYRPRSGKIETIAFRINDCILRSLNGSKALDSQSREMQAMLSYIRWLGHEVPKGSKPEGSGLDTLPFLTRPADTAKGGLVYVHKCQSCHGTEGQGFVTVDAAGYVYPPLWGPHSYNTGAGLYRLMQFATYVKNNMPFGASISQPQLSTEEAWDVAAFVNSQPRPQKEFPADWPDLSKKPVDFPFGPYTDSFTEAQHKYGPFAPIANATRRR